MRCTIACMCVALHAAAIPIELLVTSCVSCVTDSDHAQSELEAELDALQAEETAQGVKDELPEVPTDKPVVLPEAPTHEPQVVATASTEDTATEVCGARKRKGSIHNTAPGSLLHCGCSVCRCAVQTPHMCYNRCQTILRRPRNPSQPDGTNYARAAQVQALVTYRGCVPALP